MTARSRGRLPVLSLSILLSAMLVFAACGGGDDEGAEAGGAQETVSELPDCSTENIQSPPERDVSGTVRIVMEEVTDLEVVEAMIPEFNQDYPNVELDIQGANYDVIHEQEIASFQKGEGTMDLMQVDTAWIPEFAEAGFLEDLGPAIACLGNDYDYFDFTGPFREIGQSDGSIYGIPFYSYPSGFIFRPDLWGKPPETLDELVEGAKKHDSPSMEGLVLQPKSGQVIIEEWFAYLLASGGQLRDEEGNWTVDTPEAKEALETYIELYNDVAPKGSLNWHFDDTVRAAGAGEASALTTYGWVVPIVNAPENEAAGKFALAPFPGGRGLGGAWMWSIPTNSQAKDAAWAWISWITATEQDQERTITGGAPIRDSTMNNPTVWRKGVSKEYYKTFQEVAANSVPLCRGAGCAEAMELIGQHLNSAVAGTESVDEALQGAQQDAEQATG